MIMNFTLFRLAFFLLPFENLIFAPSRGWPAISPIIFFIFFILRKKTFSITKSALIKLALLVFLSCVGWGTSILLDINNPYLFRDVVTSIPPLILGLICYLVIKEEFVRNNIVQTYNIKMAIKSLIAGSIVGLTISLFILIFANQLKMDFVIQFLELILMRNNQHLRFSFLFAEPSFVSVHILGVLTPLIFLCNLIGLKKEKKYLIYILSFYRAVGVIYSQSARLLFDLTIAGYIYFLSYIFKPNRDNPKISGVQIFSSLALSVIVIILVFSQNTLIEKLSLGRVTVSSSLYETTNSDPSLASRFFRSDAVFRGILQNPLVIFTGVGFGNSGALVEEGFADAVSNFNSFYTTEIDAIDRLGSGPNIYNMYLRFIGEFGLFVFIIIVYIVFDKRLFFIFLVICLCYLQFDSYAFYGIWLYLVIKKIVSIKQQARVPYEQ